jgi:hypothetical protein
MAALDPAPGPPGYHADFSLPFGKPQDASKWVVRLGGDVYFDFVGPFDDWMDAAVWAGAYCEGRRFEVRELIRPEDWPGNGLEDPEEEEPETPLLDGLEGAP